MMLSHITRMIKFVSGPSSGEEVVSITKRSHQEPEQEEFAKRKTRISFELHPSLILEDLIIEGLFDGDDEAGIDDFLDRLEANLRAHSNAPRGVADAVSRLPYCRPRF